MITYIVISTVFAIIVIGLVVFYNKLSKNKNQIQNAISSLDSLFIQRADLIPNLIVTVKQYTVFEKETLEKITALRQPGVPSQENNPYLQNEEGTSLLKQIMIQVENYPELKASEQYSKLQYAFYDCEERISAGRRYLSASITEFNDSVVTFPANICAKIFGFKLHEWEFSTHQQRQSIDAKSLFEN
jgi:LemA protein